MSHIIGPWEVWAQSDGTDGIVNTRGEIVARVWNRDIDMQGDNARLIAASPELLRFAQLVLDAGSQGITLKQLETVAKEVVDKATRRG